MLVSKPARKAIKEGTQPLDVFFAPKTVAVIGATETANTVGRTILWNLVSNPFGGTVSPSTPSGRAC
jgi:acetyltransferase